MHKFGILACAANAGNGMKGAVQSERSIDGDAVDGFFNLGDADRSNSPRRR